jgi:acyl-CoA reductase-like NAD-dependent aldehyde dehydrogenase
MCAGHDAVADRPPPTKGTTLDTIEHWIGGRTTRGAGERFAAVFDPATGGQRAQVVLATRADVHAAVASARRAFAEWSQASLSRRTAVLFAFRQLVHEHTDERAGARGKRVQALGGAKNHAVVLPDADLESAADHLVAAAFGSAGERCMAVSAAVAVGGVAADLAAAARDRIVGLITSAEREGADLVVDGRGITVPGHENGFFVGPTVIDRVRPEMTVYREGVFGPVLSTLRAADVDEAIALVNANPYGNGTAVFTSSGEAARRFQRGVHVGMIGINVPVPVPMAYYSFGGWKDSLFGGPPRPRPGGGFPTSR